MCIGQKPIGGSNPPLSANLTQIPPPAGFFVSIASVSAPLGLAKYAMGTKTSALADVSVIVASPSGIMRNE